MTSEALCACVCGCSCVRVRVDGCVRVDEWVRVRVRACGRVLRPAPPQPTSATSPWGSTCREKSGNDERLLCPLCSVPFWLSTSRLRARETNTAVNLLDLRTCSPVLLLPHAPPTRVTMNPEEQNWHRSSVVINTTKTGLASTYRP